MVQQQNADLLEVVTFYSGSIDRKSSHHNPFGSSDSHTFTAVLQIASQRSNQKAMATTGPISDYWFYNSRAALFYS